jgi:ubiquitin carboxyl-terminal hydrolase 8
LNEETRASLNEGRRAPLNEGTRAPLNEETTQRRSEDETRFDADAQAGESAGGSAVGQRDEARADVEKPSRSPDETVETDKDSAELGEQAKDESGAATEELQPGKREVEPGNEALKKETESAEEETRARPKQATAAASEEESEPANEGTRGRLKERLEPARAEVKSEKAEEEPEKAKVGRAKDETVPAATIPKRSKSKKNRNKKSKQTQGFTGPPTSPPGAGSTQPSGRQLPDQTRGNPAPPARNANQPGAAAPQQTTDLFGRDDDFDDEPPRFTPSRSTASQRQRYNYGAKPQWTWYHREPSGVPGLENLGNTCYMNSVLQCLARIERLTTYVLSEDFGNDLNPASPFGSHGSVAREFRNLMAELQRPQYAFAPSSFKYALGRHNNLFADHGQHDANECLLTILDVVHEDLNQSRFSKGERFDRSALSGMELHAATNKSRIVDLFHGVSHTIINFSCGRREVLEEPLVVWTLPLDSNLSSMTLEDCIRFWGAKEFLDDDNQFYCSSCDKLENITRESAVHRFAPILIIQLKRFKETAWGMRKNSVPVEYPMKIDTSRHAHEPTGDYHLFGVVCHSGDLMGGHYTCVVKDSRTNKWYSISDSSVSECGESAAQHSGAYILFYQPDPTAPS